MSDGDEKVLWQEVTTVADVHGGTSLVAVRVVQYGDRFLEAETLGQDSRAWAPQAGSEAAAIYARWGMDERARVGELEAALVRVAGALRNERAKNAAYARQVQGLFDAVGGAEARARACEGAG